MAPWINRTAAAVDPEFAETNRGPLGTDPVLRVLGWNKGVLEQ